MSESNKVCHMSTVHPLFDTRIFYKECKSLEQAGYEVHLVITHDKDEIIDAINVHALPETKNRIQRMLFLPFLTLIKALKINASIYHFHDPELILVGIVLRLFQKKVIYDVHEDYPESVIRKDWIKGIIVRRIISFLVKIAEKISTYFFNSIIAATPSIAEKFNPKKTICIRNLPILKLFNKIDSNKKKNKKPIIIYAGALSRDRGIYEIIQAMGIVGNNAELWLVGQWESDKFKEKCTSDEGWENTKYLGYVKPEKAYGYMKNADIGIVNFLPVENHTEALPNKPFEYMACSLPIIMSDFPYWKEFFIECALFVDPKNLSDIAEKINQLIDNKLLQRKLGKTGRNLIDNIYSWDIEKNKLFLLYNKLSEME